MFCQRWNVKKPSDITQRPFADLFLAEARLDKVLDLRNHLVGVCPLGDKVQLRPFPRGQHHETHDALAIDALAVFLDPYIGSKSAGDLYEHGSGARMEPITVLYHDLLGATENVVSLFFSGEETHYLIRRSLIICSKR